MRPLRYIKAGDERTECLKAECLKAFNGISGHKNNDICPFVSRLGCCDKYDWFAVD